MTSNPAVCRKFSHTYEIPESLLIEVEHYFGNRQVTVSVLDADPPFEQWVPGPMSDPVDGVSVGTIVERYPNKVVLCLPPTAVVGARIRVVVIC